MTDITTALTDALAGDTDAAAALLDRFDIREKTAVRLTPPTPAAGQTWRNKRSDRLVIIAEVPAPGSDLTAAASNLRWAALTGRGPATGKVWAKDWTAKFEFIAAAPDEHVHLTGPVIYGPGAARVEVHEGRVYGSWPVLLRRGIDVIRGTRMGRYGGIMADVDGRRFVEERDEWWTKQGFEITEPTMPETWDAEAAA
ncbi:hypothetical protein ACWGJ9_09755 [Curtobacterium citreum]